MMILPQQVECVEGLTPEPDKDQSMKLLLFYYRCGGRRPFSSAVHAWEAE